MASPLFRTMKAWVVPSHVWKPSGLSAQEVAGKLGMAVVVAKPSNNLYLGKNVGGLDSVSAAISNIAGHGEIAIASIHNMEGEELSTQARRLINILPSKIEFETKKIGLKNGKLLNHFGYRKVVMNLVPESLDDHAWIACALSYSSVSARIQGFMFDPIGGGLSGGVAVETSEGAIFRGSGIADPDGVIVSPEDSAVVSLAANGFTGELKGQKMAKIEGETEFAQHRFFSKLSDMLRKASPS